MVKILEPLYRTASLSEDVTTTLSSQHSRASYLRINATLRLDPTRTVGIRKQWVTDMNKRFRAVKREVRTSVDTNDCFALREALSILAIGPRQFEFKTSEEKVAGFMDWLGQQSDSGILEVSQREGRNVVAHSAWQNVYIDSSYKQGLKRSTSELVKAGYDPSILPGSPLFSIDSLFNRPIHADRLGLLYTRAFTELKGITEGMETVIADTLAQGIADGRNPKTLARMLVNRIEKVGDLSIVDSRGRHIPALQRARVLARTEVIRAHHVAMVNTYEEAGVHGVRVLAEFSTAGDDRVCPSCAELEAQVFSLDEIRTLIPLHPQCRCVALPADIGEKVPKNRTFSKPAQRDIQKASGGLPLKETIKKGGAVAKVPKSPIPKVPLPKPLAPIADNPIHVPKPKRPPRPRINIETEIHGTVSKKFQADMRRSLRKIPREVRRVLKKNGTKIDFGDLISTIRPDLKGVTPRGWPKGTTWDNAEGLYSGGLNKQVIVTENSLVGKTVVKSNRTEGVLFHETGHAFDDALNPIANFSFSETQPFIDAYRKDVAALAGDKSPSFANLTRAQASAKQSSNLVAARKDYSWANYFLQEGYAGQHECFAEGFASLLGKAGASTETIPTLFPKAYAVIRKQIKGKGSASRLKGPKPQ